jgi:hypothetical protein
MRKRPKAPVKPGLDTAAIARRLQKPIHATDTKGKLYLALSDARSDCADLLNEVERQNALIAQMAMAFAKRIEELEREFATDIVIAMQPPAGDPAK